MSNLTQLFPGPRLEELIDAIERVRSDPLLQLSDAAVVAYQLGETADSLMGHFIDQARRAGESWTDIGASMGVTKQAAQKRFVPKMPATGSNLELEPTFTRFTPKARNVVVAAHAAAHAAGNIEVDTAHLILGLLAEPDAIAAKALLAEGTSLELVQEAASKVLPAPATETPELLTYATSAREALQLTLSEALRLNHNYVGTEHILLALLERENAQPGVLHGLGITKPPIAAAIRAALSKPNQ